MTDSREELRKRAQADGIEFFFAMFVDMHGKPCAKLVPASSFDMLMDGGAGFAGFAAGPMGQNPSDPDLSAVPDPASYTPVPWEPGLAVLQCDIHVDGEPWAYSPRVILKRQLEKLAARGITAMAGFEAEYMLVDKDENGKLVIADPLDTAQSPCYDVKALSRSLEFLKTTSRYMNQLGWENYANDHEDANGQFEQNWKYADALTSADRLIFFRYMVHVLAQREGMFATFMPKPFSNLTGNGLHIHTSLWEGDKPLFVAEGEDPRGLGISEMAYNYIGGILEHARAAVAVTCPTVNSYKRMGVGAPTSGATWAPAYVSYGGNNRCASQKAIALSIVELMARPIRISPSSQCSPRVWTGSTASSIQVHQTPTTSTRCRRQKLLSAGSSRCRQRWLRPLATWLRIPCFVRHSALVVVRTKSTTS